MSLYSKSTATQPKTQMIFQTKEGFSSPTFAGSAFFYNFATLKK